MKRWFGIVIGASTALALTMLPPDALELGTREEIPEQVRFNEARSELSRAYGELYATRWSAWLSEQAAQAEPGAFLFGPPAWEEATDEDVAAWERGYLELIEALEPRDPSVRLGVFWQPIGRAEQEAAVLGEPTVFAGANQGAPYCFLVVPYRDGRSSHPVTVWGRYGLGPCASYAQYGAPGAGIAAWLEAGAWGFGSLQSPMQDYMSLRDRPDAGIQRFGTSRPNLPGLTLAGQRCMAGDAAGCVSAVTDPAEIGAIDADDAYVVANTPASFLVDLGPYQPPFAYLDDTLLADVEREFGADAFARFWSSEEPVAQAFSAAFGVGLGEWVAGWLQAQTGTYRAGPRVAGTDLLLTLLALTAMAAMATAVAVRRQV